MTSVKIVSILLICLLLFVIFQMSRQNNVNIEKLTTQSNEAIQGLSSLYNTGNLTITSLNTTGNSTIDGNLTVSGNLVAPRVNGSMAINGQITATNGLVGNLLGNVTNSSQEYLASMENKNLIIQDKNKNTIWNSGLSPNWKYVGAYKDCGPNNSRVLSTLWPATNSIDDCMKYASMAGHPIIGFQWGNQCFSAPKDTDYTIMGEAPMTGNCSTTSTSYASTTKTSSGLSSGLTPSTITVPNLSGSNCGCVNMVWVNQAV